MKKHQFAALCIVFLSNAMVFGQNAKWTFSVEGAPSMAYFKGKDFFLKDPKVGYSGGLGVQYRLSQHWRIKTGMSYESKGGAENLVLLNDLNGTPLGQSTIRYNLNYVVIPLLAQLTFGKKLPYFFEWGAFSGIKVAANYNFANLPNSDMSELTGKLEFVQPFDLGVSVGGGIQIPITNRLSIPVQVRGNFGLVDVMRLPENAAWNTIMRTNSLNFITGLTYQLTEKTTK